MPAIHVLNLNIWNYNAPWPERRRLIIDLIRQTQPDVVALEEVRYQDWLNTRHQADQILTGLTGYDAVWQPAAYWPRGQESNQGQQWEGLAILSRHPIVDQAMTRLSRDPGDPHNHFDRLVMGAQIRTPANPFWLFVTHFPLSAQARERAAPIAADFVVRTAGELPLVFTGDLNALPSTPPIQFLTGQRDINGKHSPLQDAWTMCHPDRNGNTFPAWGPHKRIDYMFVSPNIEVHRIEIVGAVNSRDIVSPSDHCGLLATLQIE